MPSYYWHVNYALLHTLLVSLLAEAIVIKNIDDAITINFAIYFCSAYTFRACGLFAPY